MGLLEELESRILVGDGATGTLLYSYGVDRCFEEMNVSAPNEIERIHEAYIEAGAHLIQTNTYGANYIKLSRYGLEDDTKDFNIEAVRIAKRAAKKAVHTPYVVGTIGGIRSFRKSAFSLDEIKRNFREQLYLLLSEEIDGLLLETYYDLEELRTVLTVARKETDLPIITNVSLHEPGVLQDGTPVQHAFTQLESLGANIIGINCRLGPHHMLAAFEQVPLLQHAHLSAYPNGSLPSYENGRLVYHSDEQYFYESALKFREQGVRLLGGCCGTTPKHIKAMADAVRSLPPIRQKNVKTLVTNEIKVKTKPQAPPLQDIVKEKRSIIVELDPPKTLGLQTFIDGAKALHEQGIDAITLADNSLASPRVSNLACASILKQSVKNLRSLIHLTCRDRNLIGLQSHLMGLHELGFHDILAITGDPSKIGDFPGATSVYDLSSLDLISLIKQFNEGISYSGKPLGEKTNFSVAAAFNPNVRHLDKAVLRLEKKIDCGADYFITQPLYSVKQIEDVYEATKHLQAPLYLGIMPLTSYRNAEFIHNEIPGIQLSDDIREAMRKTGDNKERGKQEGIAIAKTLIDAAFERFNGIYLITPFLHYDMTVELSRYIQEKEQAKVAKIR